MSQPYTVPCDGCSQDILPHEDIKQTDGDRHLFHVACAPYEDASDECYACEAERRGLEFDISSECTGSYCDEHAGEHEDAWAGMVCPYSSVVHRVSDESDS